MATNAIGMWLRKPQVTVLVGPNKAKYSLPKELVVQDNLAFFKVAFTNAAYKECTTNVMELPEDDPKAFDLFVDWLFLQRVPAIPKLPSHSFIPYAKMVEAKMLDHEMPWHRLLCMASKFCSPGLQKDALQKIQDFHDQTKTVCHPDLLEHDLANSLPNRDLAEYVLKEFRRLEFGPHEDFIIMVDFLQAKEPELFAVAVKQMHEILQFRTKSPSGSTCNGYSVK